MEQTRLSCSTLKDNKFFLFSHNNKNESRQLCPSQELAFWRGSHALALNFKRKVGNSKMTNWWLFKFSKLVPFTNKKKFLRTNHAWTRNPDRFFTGKFNKKFHISTHIDRRGRANEFSLSSNLHAFSLIYFISFAAFGKALGKTFNYKLSQTLRLNMSKGSMDSEWRRLNLICLAISLGTCSLSDCFIVADVSF